MKWKECLVVSCLLFGTACTSVATKDFSMHEAVQLKPNGIELYPILVFVHGGAWISGDKTQYQFVADSFTKQGVCVVLVNYGLAPKKQHPKPVEELNAIIETVIAEDKTKNCDHQRLFLMGHSAGAHMIASWASTYAEPKVQGFIGLEGIYDLPKLAETWPQYRSDFLTAAFGKEKNWSAASPARQKMKNQSPWLLVHSEQDELVDLKQSQSFQKSLVEQEIKVDFMAMNKENHFQVVQIAALAGSPLNKRILAFISIYGGP